MCTADRDLNRDCVTTSALSVGSKRSHMQQRCTSDLDTCSPVDQLRSCLRTRNTSNGPSIPRFTNLAGTSYHHSPSPPSRKSDDTRRYLFCLFACFLASIGNIGDFDLTRAALRRDVPSAGKHSSSLTRRSTRTKRNAHLKPAPIPPLPGTHLSSAHRTVNIQTTNTLQPHLRLPHQLASTRSNRRRPYRDWQEFHRNGVVWELGCG